MFETLELQYLNKLVKGEVRDFASPETFHRLKVQRLGSNRIKPPTQVGRPFVVPISALVGDLTIKACEFTNSTPPEELTQTLDTALQGLDALDAAQTNQHRRAIIYLASLIYHRRSPEEREALIKVVDAHARGMEVETMLQSMAETTYQQGIEQGIEQGETRAKQEALLKLLRHRFPSVPETVITQVRALRSPVELDALFEKSLTAESIEELPWRDPEA